MYIYTCSAVGMRKDIIYKACNCHHKQHTGHKALHWHDFK